MTTKSVLNKQYYCTVLGAVVNELACTLTIKFCAQGDGSNGDVHNPRDSKLFADGASLPLKSSYVKGSKSSKLSGSLTFAFPTSLHGVNVPKSISFQFAASGYSTVKLLSLSTVGIPAGPDPRTDYRASKRCVIRAPSALLSLRLVIDAREPAKEDYLGVLARLLG